ncbi:hypothetical protein [Methylobacterium fujisawaense]
MPSTLMPTGVRMPVESMSMRARIETGGFTETAVTDQVRAVWRDLLEA